MATLLDEYAAIAEWDVSTRQTNEGFIRRTIKPALGHMEVRKVCGPVLDKLYVRLKRCGDLTCTGKPFNEHRNFPVLAISPTDSRPAWRQVAGMLADAIRSGAVIPGDELPSITEVSKLHEIGTGVIRHALETLTAEGLIVARQGRSTIVAGDPAGAGEPRAGLVTQLAWLEVLAGRRKPLHGEVIVGAGGRGKRARRINECSLQALPS